jgi:energy-coupling factor transport system ATP-binding protein
MSVLELESVTYTYPEAAAPSLREVSLAVDEGEFVVLAGPSAGGKSTMLRAASGLVPHFHGGTFGGRVVVAGLDTREHGPADLSAVAGSLLQDPESQVVLTTVRAELGFPLENHGHAPAAVARGVEEAALALGIAHLLDRPTTELSGGELQRVAIARALVHRPAVLLADEPTGNLDPDSAAHIVALLREAVKREGATAVLATHSPMAAAAADRVLLLRADGLTPVNDEPR